MSKRIVQEGDIRGCYEVIAYLGYKHPCGLFVPQRKQSKGMPYYRVRCLVCGHSKPISVNCLTQHLSQNCIKCFKPARNWKKNKQITAIASATEGSQIAHTDCQAVVEVSNDSQMSC